MDGQRDDFGWQMPMRLCGLPLRIVPKSNARPVSDMAVRLLVIVAIDPLDRGVMDEADDPLGHFLDLLLRHVQRLA